MFPNYRLGWCILQCSTEYCDIVESAGGPVIKYVPVCINSY